MTDDDYHRLTGLTKNQFDRVAKSVEDKIRSTTNRSTRKCLVLLLIKLRTGLSHSILSTLLAMDRRKVSRTVRLRLQEMV